MGGTGLLTVLAGKFFQFPGKFSQFPGNEFPIPCKWLPGNLFHICQIRPPHGIDFHKCQIMEIGIYGMGLGKKWKMAAGTGYNGV